MDPEHGLVAFQEVSEGAGCSMAPLVNPFEGTLVLRVDCVPPTAVSGKEEAIEQPLAIDLILLLCCKILQTIPELVPRAFMLSIALGFMGREVEHVTLEAITLPDVVVRACRDYWKTKSFLRSFSICIFGSASPGAAG